MLGRAVNNGESFIPGEQGGSCLAHFLIWLDSKDPAAGLKQKFGKDPRACPYVRGERMLRKTATGLQQGNHTRRVRGAVFDVVCNAIGESPGRIFHK